MNVQLNSLSDLAWAHFWQVTAVVLCVAVLVRLLGRTRPHLAYLLWLLVFVKCVTPPIWSCPTGVFSWINARVIALPPRIDRDPGMSPASMSALSDIAAAGAREGADFQAGAPRVEPAVLRTDRMDTAPVLLLAVWVGGVLLFLIVLTRRTLCWRSALRRSTVASDNALNSLVTELCRQLAVKRQVRIRITREPLGPAVIGVFRPTILLPEVVLAKASMSQIEPIVAHELVHIRRRDNAVGLLQSIAQLLWWFHPMVWWANRTACAERERCCDEEVVACLGRGPEWYAQGLLNFLKLKRELRPLFAVSGISPYEVTRSRLEDIMRCGKTFHQRMPRRYWLVFLAAMLVLGPGRGLMLRGDAGGAGDADFSHAPTKNASATLAPDGEAPAVPAAEGEPLLAINGDGSNLRKLVAMPDYTSIGSPDWSRDGTRIAFDAWRSSIGETYVDGHVFVVNADGGKPIDLGPGAMPSWSPDGKRIVFCQYSPNQGVWITAPTAPAISCSTARRRARNGVPRAIKSPTSRTRVGPTSPSTNWARAGGERCSTSDTPGLTRGWRGLPTVSGSASRASRQIARPRWPPSTWTDKPPGSRSSYPRPCPVCRTSSRRLPGAATGSRFLPR